MNLKEGRIGRQESVAMCAMAMTVSGIFTIVPQDAYGGGNSTFISLPIGIIISLLIFLLAVKAIKSSQSRHLSEMFEFGLGFGGRIIDALVILSLIGVAYLQLSHFTTLLHGFIYEGNDYFNITIFMLVVVALLACMGLESISRTSLCFAVLLAISALTGCFIASSGFEVHRLYPFVGDGVGHMLEYSISRTWFFLPGLLTLLIACKGVHGVNMAKKSGLASAAVALVICAIIQLSISLVFSYEELSGIFSPFYQLNQGLDENNYFLRMDRVGIFIWLIATMISSALYVYVAALTYTRAFRQSDIRPAASSLGLAVIFLVLLEKKGLGAPLTSFAHTLTRYGYIGLTPMIIIASIAAIIRAAVKQKRKVALNE